MARVVVTPRAEADLRAIWLSIAIHNVHAADRLLLAIDEKFQRLVQFPDLGAPRFDLGAGLRMVIEGNYLVLYEHHSDRGTIEVVSVADGRRDLTDWR